MALEITELAALRKKLDRDRRELEERERALALVEQMLREERLDSPELQPLSIPDMPTKPDSLTGSVKAAVMSLADREFSVPDVERYLLHVGVELPKNDPRSRIAMVLQSLREKDMIVKTYSGKGRDPHRYRIGPLAKDLL